MLTTPHSFRDVRSPEPTTIPRAIETLKTGGFVNYYGMQRFGTAPIPTHAIGLALLRGEWALAASLILREREGEGEDVEQARQAFAAGLLDEAIRLMPRRSVAERAILEAYKKTGQTDHLSAMGKVRTNPAAPDAIGHPVKALTQTSWMPQIPKNLRMMYVHAYQSYVWNKAVSARIELFGCKEVVEGDLVLEGGAELNEEDAAAEAAVDAPEAKRGQTFSLDPDLDDGKPSWSRDRFGSHTDLSVCFARRSDEPVHASPGGEWGGQARRRGGDRELKGGQGARRHRRGRRSQAVLDL